MIFEFIRLQLLKATRSIALTRNIIAGLMVAFFVFIVLVNLLVLAFSLPSLIEESLAIKDSVAFINANLLYFFLAEVLYRFFLQKLPVFELEHFLHLPVKRSRIIHFLLIKSIISPFSVVALICFGPFSFITVGVPAAYSWLVVILIISWSLHWLMLWYKQQYGNHLPGIFSLFLIAFLAFSANYYGYYNAGSLAGPFFEWSLTSSIPVILVTLIFCLSYLLTFRYYRKHAYLEELDEKGKTKSIQKSVNLLSGFGLNGEIADLELKLIFRHKKSRSYLLFTGLFLLYGLFFYDDPSLAAEDGFSYLFIFAGTFITGSFLVQYGQLFLSWNSAGFDFYLSRKEGLKALIKGKYLLFFMISLFCFLLTIPYVYFGWDILFIHFATFLFNMGISIHMIIYFSLWKPLPMDLSKGAMFNYEGVGIAQFLMTIPLVVFPYLIFIPFTLLLDDYFGLIVLGGVGIVGLIFSDRLSDICVRKLEKNRHQISSTFRQEL